MAVPAGAPTSRTCGVPPESAVISSASTASMVRVVMVMRDSAAMEGIASPRKPKVESR